jgi:serine/threonine protein kinase/outer membrane protein assembly factor BamD (BamD/ComL family)
MGDVYAALDLKSQPPREVALKTIRDAADATAAELFKRECGVLMSFTHPNVVELYETGEFEDRGVTKPFFVMARLRGVTLAQLIKDSPQRLTVQRTIDIIYQVSRGLQAAHEHDLVHRDVKPSNIFVLEDDSVKVIDFGVAHLMSVETIGAKGTLYYMAPEQFEGKPATPATDVFSLGVVCFEALTRRRPFEGTSPDEIRAEIMKHVPPPASNFNPAVGAALSQVIHAAMAKRPAHRFSSAREFGECLRKALRNEPIERFEPSKLHLRLARVERQLEASQYDVASEILGQLEEEGYLHPAVNELRRQVDQALRNRDIRQFLETARRFAAQDEYTLALQKVQDALQLEPGGPEALELRSEIEAKRSSAQIGNWLSLAQKHLSNCAFELAREAVASALHMIPTDVSALRLMSEINRVEQDVMRKGQEKERYFESAVELRKKGDLTAALSRLQHVLELDREAPDALRPERGAAFQKFYNEVRSEYETIRGALDEAKAALDAKNYAPAESICDKFLEKYPNHALFQALKYDIGERERQDLSSYIAEVDREVEAEPDLERKIKILEEALVRYPEELHFERALKGIKARHDFINGLVSQARNLEERGQYLEAIDKWETMRSIYKQYPGLDVEVDRIRRRLEQHARSEAKTRWVERIDGALNSGDYASALDLVQQALAESPQDAQLLPLERLARQRVEQSKRAQSLLELGQKLLNEKSIDKALELLKEAHSLDEHSAFIRAVYVEAILNKASATIDTDLGMAERLLETAFGLDATNPRVKSMRVLASDRRRTAAVEQYLSRARELQATNELEQARGEVEKGLGAYPGDARLIQLQTVLANSLKGSQEQSELRRDRDKILELRRNVERSNDPAEMKSLLDEALVLARKHPHDKQIQIIADEIGAEIKRRNATTAPATAELEEPVTGRKAAAQASDTAPPLFPGPKTLNNYVQPRSRLRLFRPGVMVPAALTLIAAGIIAARSFVTPPPEFKALGTAVVRSSLSLHKEPFDASDAIGKLDAGQSVEVLNPLPPLRLNEWALVRPLGKLDLRGYITLGDLDGLRTDNRQLDLWHALAMIKNASDWPDRKSRLQAIDESLQAMPLAVSKESDNVYLELSEDYAQLAQATDDANASTAALRKAEEYFNRIEGSLGSSERAQKQKALIPSIHDKLFKVVPTGPQPQTPPAPSPGPSVGQLLNSARILYGNGRVAEQNGDADEARTRYTAAIKAAERVLAADPANVEAKELLKTAKDAALGTIVPGRQQ